VKVLLGNNDGTFQPSGISYAAGAQPMAIASGERAPLAAESALAEDRPAPGRNYSADLHIKPPAMNRLVELGSEPTIRADRSLLDEVFACFF
jgi:hypothetical protein